MRNDLFYIGSSRYLWNIPKQIRKGRVLMHNRVRH